MELDEEIERLSKQLKYKTDNLRDTQEFKKTTRQIEIAYEDQINYWRSECENGKEKFREI
jgi:hypothetical protein